MCKCASVPTTNFQYQRQLVLVLNTGYLHIFTLAHLPYGTGLLSLPGERIGYLLVSDKVHSAEDFIAAATAANRHMGIVNAPSLMQRVVMRVLDEKTDIGFYDANRKALTQGLEKCGFTFVWPEGAFYLWLKSPESDDSAFVKRAKKYNLLLVPGSSFGCAGYVRIAYCVSAQTIANSMEGFAKLAAEYGLETKE